MNNYIAKAITRSVEKYSRNKPIPFNGITSLYWLQQTIGFDRSLWKHKEIHQHDGKKRYGNFLDDSVFIIGAPRSGTTFLGDVLSLDYQFIYFYEVVALKAMASLVHRHKLRGQKLKLVMEFYYGVLMWSHRAFKLRVLDKNPMHCFTIDELSKIYKSSKFIFIYRDGRDAALSLMKSGWHNENNQHGAVREVGGYPIGNCPWWFIEEDRREEYVHTSDIHRCMWIWRIYNQEAIKALANISDGRVLWVKYEDLIKCPNQEVERCFHFMGSQYSNELKGRSNILLQKVMSGNSGKYKKELSEETLKQIEKEGIAMLERLNYL